MRTRFIHAVALAALPLAFACSKTSYPTSTKTPNPPPAAGSVIIADFSFSPAALTVARGTTVKWTNHGPATHTVTSNTGVFDSGNIAAPNGTFSYTFATAGTYAYHCSIHPNMTGSITVTP